MPLGKQRAASYSYFAIYVMPRVGNRLLSFRITAHLDNWPLRRVRSPLGRRLWHSFSTDRHSSSIRSTPEAPPYYNHSLSVLRLKWVWPQTGKFPRSTPTSTVSNPLNLQKRKVRYPSSMHRVPCLNRCQKMPSFWFPPRTPEITVNSVSLYR